MLTRKASDIMTHPVVTIAADTLLTDAIKMLLRHHISGLPVVDADGKLIGIITEFDIMNFALSGDAANTNVSEAMTRNVETISPETGIPTIVEIFSTRRVRRLPVVEDDKVMGIVSRRDLLRAMLFLYDRY